MALPVGLINPIIKTLSHALCRVDVAQLSRLPQQGPLILIGNHINFLDVPLLITHAYPRKVTGFAKVETWDNPILGALFTAWEAIPIRRGEADLAAIRQALAVLEARKMIGIAPEGTRSGDGKLRQGKPGVVTLASMSGAPMLPVAFYGIEHLKQNLSRLRRSNFHVVVGEPFRLRSDIKIKHDTRQLITDEIMYQLAALLPAENRGFYADLSKASTQFIEPYQLN